MKPKDEDFDIRVVAEAVDQVVKFFCQLHMLAEADRAVTLSEYIHETYRLEEDLEKRADYIETEFYALTEAIREVKGRHEKDDI